MHRERRTHFLINKRLQFHYLLTLTLVVVLIVLSALASMYFGMWGKVIATFSDETIQNDLVTASRLQQYEEARRTQLQPREMFSSLSLFVQAKRLSERQKEVFKEIPGRINQNLLTKLLPLFALVALGAIFLSHKIAGPLYRCQQILEEASSGNLTVRCHLRKGDETQSLSETLNRTLKNLDERVSRLKRIVKEAGKNPDRMIFRLKEELFRFKTSAER